MALALIKWLFGEICTCSSYIRSSSIAFVRTRFERLCSICTVHSLRNSHICPDRSTDTLAHVITKLASTKAHRVYVVENGKATSVISLTDLLRHIYTNPDFADW
jgi:CBS-domain-containing membrane protein